MWKKLSTLPVDFWPSRSIFPIYPFRLSPSPSVKAFQVREFHRMPKVIKNCLMNKPLNNRMLLRWEKVGRKLCALRKYSPHFATFFALSMPSYATNWTRHFSSTTTKLHKFSSLSTFSFNGPVLQFVFAVNVNENHVDEIHVKLYHHQIFKCDIFV